MQGYRITTIVAKSHESRQTFDCLILANEFYRKQQDRYNGVHHELQLVDLATGHILRSSYFGPAKEYKR